MASLTSLFRWLGIGARSGSAAQPAPPPDVPLGELETAKDRIVDAIAARGDINVEAKASATANIKGIYYMVLAARDLAQNDDRETNAQVCVLLDRAARGTANYARDLRELGEKGEDLARNLEAAFHACQNAVSARLPPPH